MFRFLTTTFLLCAIPATQALGTGEWSASCSSASIQLGELQANCNTPPMGPPWICSELDLNKCYAFSSNGGIYAKDGGNLGNHCEGCELDDDGHTMRCQCREGESLNQSYYIDTDLIIRNQDGYLYCYNHKGTKCQPDMALAGNNRSMTFTA